MRLAAAMVMLPTMAFAQSMQTTVGAHVVTHSASILNVRAQCGAAGNGGTDDSAALSACLTQAALNPNKRTVYLPAGVYRIAANTLPIMSRGVSVVGDGPHASYILVDPAYSGDVLAWSEAWIGPGITPTVDKTGPVVAGIAIYGSKASPNTQHGIAFYDRNDFAIVRDVSISNLNGACLYIGHAKAQAVSYLRESSFWNLQCAGTGTASIPAVEISSTTVVTEAAATSDLRFFNLNLFDSGGVGIAIRNPNAYSAVRLIEFYSPRVEYSAADNIQIGGVGDAGTVSNIRFYGTQSLTPGGLNSGYYGINVGLSTAPAYDIQFFGAQVGPCWSPSACKGIRVDNVRIAKFEIGNIYTADTNVTYTARVGTSVVLDMSGQENSMTYAVDPAVHVISPSYRQVQ